MSKFPPICSYHMSDEELLSMLDSRYGRFLVYSVRLRKWMIVPAFMNNSITQ